MADNIISVSDYYRVKGPCKAAWPHSSNPNRKRELSPDDVLLKASDGSFQIANGVTHSGIHINPNLIVHYNDTIQINPIVEM